MHQQCLSFNGVYLEDHMTLSHLGIYGWGEELYENDGND